MTTRRQSMTTIAFAAALAAGLGACGSSDDASSTSSPGDAAVTGTDPSSSGTDVVDGAVDLASVCPPKVVVQTDWYPSPEHGYLYSMIGEGGTVDTDSGTYTGPIKGANIDLEIRSGGPYLGFQATSSIMYQDPDILLGYEITDGQVQNSGELPTVAVMAPFERNPQILMWDPEKYDFASFADIGESDATVLYFGGATFVEYLIGIGDIRREQVDGGYDGSPARFVADETVVQQGFATSEPYNYENIITDFGRPVSYLVIDDAGYNVYAQALVARPEVITDEADCLTALVPMIQQAAVDFYADPQPTNQVILDVVKELDTSWVLDQGLMDYSAETTIEQGFVANGPDGVLGSMDDARMTRMVDLLVPLLSESGTVADGLTASDLYTNEFLDTSISLP